MLDSKEDIRTNNIIKLLKLEMDKRHINREIEKVKKELGE